MANLSYCRWENTANDLQDCMNSLSDVHDFAEWFEALSSYEQQGVRNILSMAKTINEELASEFQGAGVEF